MKAIIEKLGMAVNEEQLDEDYDNKSAFKEAKSVVGLTEKALLALNRLARSKWAKGNKTEKAAIESAMLKLNVAHKEARKFAGGLGVSAGV